jgi:hypothetical protein
VIETTKTLQSNPSLGQGGYYALSYTWGDSSLKKRIEIDGRPFNITQNLSLALRYLRHQQLQRLIWADGLCINQSDTEERNRHVAQMRDIYSAAKETTIFLGEATPGSNALFKAIQRSLPGIALAQTKGAVIRTLVAASGMKKSELIDEAYKILWRPYWKRIWIFQEIVVSHNPWVQCGHAKVPWEYFCQALIALLSLRGSVYFGAGYGNETRKRLEDVYWERRAYRNAKWKLGEGEKNRPVRWAMDGGSEFEGRMRLLDLLATKRASEATDKRDMVFAVSGIAMMPRPLDITYEKSVPLVFME